MRKVANKIKIENSRLQVINLWTKTGPFQSNCLEFNENATIISDDKPASAIIVSL